MDPVSTIAASHMLAGAVRSQVGTAVLKKVLDAVEVQAEAAAKMMDQARQISVGKQAIEMVEEAADLQARLAAGLLDDELIGHMIDVLG